MWDRPYALIWLANLLTMVALGLFLYAALWFVAHSPWFPLRTVDVKGKLTHVTQQQLEYVVQNEFKGTFFTLKVAAIRDAFSKLPWVKQVTVYRRWPDKVEVILEEYQLLARWGESGLIDSKGIRFEAASNEILPVLEGPEGSEQEMAEAYIRFKHILAQIGKVPTHIWLSPRRAWKIELDKDMIVEIGRDDVDERLTRFTNVYAYSLAKLDRQKVKYVDLRYANGFAVRLPHYQPTSKET